MRTLIRHLFGPVLLLGLGAVAIPAVAADLANDCMDCHGPKGVSTESDVPTIAGASAYYLEDAMAAYREHRRPCAKSAYRSGDTARPKTDMCAVASALDEAQTTKVAEYFADQPFVAAKQSFDAAQAATGKTLHEQHCEKCHVDGGSSADDDAGILAGQWMPYLRTTMAEFADGSREVPKKMKPKIEELSPDQVEALVQYYGSLQ